MTERPVKQTEQSQYNYSSFEQRGSSIEDDSMYFEDYQEDSYKPEQIVKEKEPKANGLIARIRAFFATFFD